MTPIMEALLLTRETLMILPLIVFCFIPVYQNIRSSFWQLSLKIISVLISLEVIMFFVYLLVPPEPATCFNMLLVVCCLFYCYQKEIDLERSHLWFVFVTACLLGAFSYLFYHVIDIFVHPISRMEHYTSLKVLLFEHLFEWSIIVILFYPTKKYFGWLVREFHEEWIWKTIWILPAVFTILSRFLVPYDNQKAYIGRFLEIYISVLIVLFVLTILIYVMFYQIAYSIVEKQKIVERTHCLELEIEHYKHLQSHIQETRRIRHDFRHQLVVITELLKNKKYEELETYVDAYAISISTKVKQYSDRSAINAVLCHYEELCKQEHIMTRFSLQLKDAVPITDIDFCVVLGNLLENAVAACRGLSRREKEITLKMGQTSSRVLALQIHNPYAVQVKKKNGVFLSAKHEGEGQGLQSVQMIVQKYDGFMEVNHKNQIFEVRILLNF